MIKALVKIDRIGGISGERVFVSQIKDMRIFVVGTPNGFEVVKTVITPYNSNTLKVNTPELLEVVYKIINDNALITWAVDEQIALISYSKDRIIEITPIKINKFIPLIATFPKHENIITINQMWGLINE